MDYQLTQTGDEVQEILNQAPTTAEGLADEVERATEKEGDLQDDIDAINGKIPAAASSENPLTDKEYVDGQVQEVSDDVAEINGKIPAAASADNQLADKQYVNDKISEADAEFKGTYNSLEELQTQVTDANKNDYAFVIATDAQGNTVYKKYKYVVGTGWVFEYDLNNSTFSAEQWAAINSAITSALVAKLLGLPTAAQLETQLNAIIGSVSAEATRAQGIEGGLRTDVNANALAIANEKTRAEGVEGTLSTAINNEKLRAEGAEGTLQGNINAEALLRQNADGDLQDNIDAINAKIPTQASSSNKLVDQALMNSSISTATATFRGTYNTLEQLEAVTADANDYGFVRQTDADGNVVYNRYKYVDGTGWVFEYALNNSSFTAVQWAAINSGITALLVAKLSALPDADALAAMFAAITEKIPSAATSDNKLVDYAQMVAALALKQNTLTFDTTPLEGSTNPVTSGGVYTQLANLVTAIAALQSGKQDVLTFDEYPTAGSNNPVKSKGIKSKLDEKQDTLTFDTTPTANSTNPVTSGGVKSALDLKANQSDLTSLAGRVTTAEGNISTNAADIAALQQLYNNLQQSAPIPVTSLPASGDSGKIYRLAGTNSYSDYMWNGTTWVLMATYDNATDNEPTKDSNNLVKSGGVFNNIGAFDISEYNATENPHTLATYADLTAALAALPTTHQKGGMSVKFVQSSDNKYVQYRLMSDSFNTTPANWQGVDDEPTENSKNLVESGGVILNITKTLFSDQLNRGFFNIALMSIGQPIDPLTDSDNRKYLKVAIKKGQVLCVNSFTEESTHVAALFTTDASDIVTDIQMKFDINGDNINEPFLYVTQNDGFAYINCDTTYVSSFKCSIIPFTELKSFLDKTTLLATSLLGRNYNDLKISLNGYFLTSGDKGSTASTTPTTGGNWGYKKINCSAGDNFILSSNGGTNARAYAFCDSNNIVLESSDADKAVCKIVTAPVSTSYIIVNNNYNYNEYPLFTKIDKGILSYLNEYATLDKHLYGDDYKEIEVLQNVYFLRSGDKGSTASTTPTYGANWGYIKLSCQENDQFILKVSGGGNARAYAFCDSNNIVLSSSKADVNLNSIIKAPSQTSYLIINNNFNNDTNPVLIKLSNGILEYLNNFTDNYYQREGALQEVQSSITGYFINTSGVNQYTSGNNRQINDYHVSAGVYEISRIQGNNSTRGFRVTDMSGNITQLGHIGWDSIRVTDYVCITEESILSVFFINTESVYVKKTCTNYFEEKINDIKTTNAGCFVLPHNKIVLCGASISSPFNGYFEYAMQELEIDGLNVSEAATNIFKLAYLLYTNPSDYDNYDVLMISHIHNYDVFSLPSGKENFTSTDYENDSFLGDYITTADYYENELSAAGGYTANELYAMGYDYVLKKWAKLCYDLKGTNGWDSKSGKPFQVIVYTYWHDGRTHFNSSIRRLAKKWGLYLIKDDENIGFTRFVLNPSTQQQWSLLYGDSVRYNPSEEIEGVWYGFHPDTITAENYTLWQNSGVLQLSYLPYIQQRRAGILIKALKNAILGIL